MRDAGDSGSAAAASQPGEPVGSSRATTGCARHRRIAEGEEEPDDPEIRPSEHDALDVSPADSCDRVRRAVVRHVEADLGVPEVPSRGRPEDRGRRCWSLQDTRPFEFRDRYLFAVRTGPRRRELDRPSSRSARRSVSRSRLRAADPDHPRRGSSFGIPSLIRSSTVARQPQRGVGLKMPTLVLSVA